jgi:glycosyltransferase involved in cell wall biosynthesis
MILSIIIPVYNERNTIGAVLTKVSRSLPLVSKEVVIVDDCSNDGSREWLRMNFPEGTKAASRIDMDSHGNIVFLTDPHAKTMTITTLYLERKMGKGGGVRTGLAVATGDVIVIQDADLEYDPQDWQEMYDLIAVRKVADVVYGSRFGSRPHRSLYYHHYLANRGICMLVNLLYNQTLSDIEVCYKMFTREVKESLKLTCDDFGFEVQITAQIARMKKWRLYELAICYYGRSYEEGKKITWKDGVKALWYVIKFRFV